MTAAHAETIDDTSEAHRTRRLRRGNGDALPTTACAPP